MKRSIFKPRSEFAMVRSAQRRLLASGLSTRTEVPVLGRSIDLVYLKHSHIFSIEFKLHNWKRALCQAIDHQLGADFSFICLPERKVSNEMEFALASHGIGLLFFQPNGPSPWKEIYPASVSKRTWSPMRAIILAKLNLGLQ